MHPVRIHTALREGFKPAMASLLAALFIWVAVSGAASALHAASHVDGGSHDCALCLFSNGLVLAADAPPLIASLSLLVLLVVFAAYDPLPSSVDLRLAPSRGPPLRS